MNEDFLRAKLKDMLDAVRELRTLTSKPFDTLSKYEKLSMRYLVIQVVESALSICLHIVSELGLIASTYSECFELLEGRIIDGRLASNLASAARLRNLLVHRYWEISDELLYESVKRGLGDFRGIRGEGVEMELKYYKLNEEERRKLIEDLRAKLEVYEDIVFAYVHGSFLRGRFRDVDVAIWIRGGKVEAFHYTVEVSSELSKEFPVDLHVLNEAPVPFQYHVFTKGRLLFSRDERARSEAVDRALKVYLDFREFLRSLGRISSPS